jgi:hypothetical protein
VIGLLGLSLAVAAAAAEDKAAAEAAQTAGTTDTLATFTSASSISMGQNGTVWVADRGAGHLVRITPDGISSKVALPGGRPTAVDASGGLRILVADELEGTIDVLGLSGDLLMRLRLPASADEAFTSAPEFLEDQANATRRPSGTAGDVVQLASGGLVAVESSAGFLVFWDESGRAQRTVAEAGGRRIRPQHLARTPSGIAVSEPDRNRILFFDAFGTFSEQTQLPSTPQGVAASGAEVWVASSRHLICLSPDQAAAGPEGCPTQRAILDNPAGSGVVDLAVTAEAFYLLTPRALLRLSR